MPEETSTVAFDALIQQAIRHFQNQDWCCALTNFDRLAQRDPRNAEIHNYRARVLEALGRPEDALQSLDLALAINPRNLADLRNRAIVLTRLGRLTEAVASYDIALKLRPADPDLLVRRAMALNQIDRRYSSFNFVNFVLR